MIDFSQYSFGEGNKVEKEETFTFSNKKAKVVLAFAFILLLIAMVEMGIFLVFHFPQGNYWFFLALNVLAFLFCVVMIFSSAKLRKKAKQNNADTSYARAGNSVYLLTALMYVTIAAVFIGRIINPDFLPVL